MPTAEWNVTFGLGYYNTAYQIIQTNDGGYAVSGMYGPTGNPLYVAIVKYSANGSLLWKQSYNIRFINYPNTGMLQTNDSGFAIVGNQYENRILTLIKTDSIGKIQWKQTYGVSCIASGMTQTSDGGYLIIGDTAYNGKTSPSVLIIKINSLGEIQWKEAYGTGAKYFRAVLEADNGCYVAAGNSFSISTQQFSAWLVKVDNSGNVLWDRKITSTIEPEYQICDNDIFGLTKTVDNGYALAGRINYGNFSGKGGITKGLLIKTDSAGTVLWNKTYDTSGQIQIYSVIQTSDNGYALAGSAFNDMLLIKTDEIGNEQWRQTFGGSQDADVAYSVVETVDDAFALAGKTNPGNTATGGYYYVVKTTSASVFVDSGASSSVQTEEPNSHCELTVVAALLIIIIIGILSFTLMRKHRTHPVAPWTLSSALNLFQNNLLRKRGVYGCYLHRSGVQSFG